MIVTNSDEYASKIKKIKAFGYNKNLNERSLPGLYDVDELVGTIGCLKVMQQ